MEIRRGAASVCLSLSWEPGPLLGGLVGPNDAEHVSPAEVRFHTRAPAHVWQARSRGS